MAALNPFVPKQAIPFDGKLLMELQGSVTDTVARDVIRDDNVPNILSTSVVHDNGCGYGACTMALMAADPPTGLRIHATDVNPTFIAQLQATITQNPAWPVKVENMDACNQTFHDNTFTYSFTTFIFTCFSDDVSAAKHILRTLKPGGTGVIAVWNEMPWHIALENAHRKTRGAKEPMAPLLSNSWYKKEKLGQVLEDAGWEDVTYIQKAAWLELGSDLRRWQRSLGPIWLVQLKDGNKTDESNWDEAIDIIVKELLALESRKVEDGIHKIRMVADIAIVHKV